MQIMLSVNTARYIFHGESSDIIFLRIMNVELCFTNGASSRNAKRNGMSELRLFLSRTIWEIYASLGDSLGVAANFLIAYHLLSRAYAEYNRCYKRTITVPWNTNASCHRPDSREIREDILWPCRCQESGENRTSARLPKCCTASRNGARDLCRIYKYKLFTPRTERLFQGIKSSRYSRRT